MQDWQSTGINIMKHINNRHLETEEEWLERKEKVRAMKLNKTQTTLKREPCFTCGGSTNLNRLYSYGEYGKETFKTLCPSCREELTGGIEAKLQYMTQDLCTRGFWKKPTT